MLAPNSLSQLPVLGRALARLLPTVALTFSLSAGPAAAADEPDPVPETLAVLLAGLEGLPAADTRGGVTCYGASAWPLATAGDVPVVAAATLGEGRVVVTTQGSLFDAYALGDETTREFARRTLRWLGRSKRKAKLALLDYGSLPVAQALEWDWVQPYTKADVVVVSGEQLTPGFLEPLHAWVMEGGGVLLVTPDWTPKSEQPPKADGRDSTANRFLAPFGLAIDGREANGVDALTITPPATVQHAGAAWAALASGAALSEEQRRIARLALLAAARNVEDDDPRLLRELRRLDDPQHAPALATGLRKELTDALGERTLTPLGQRWGPWYLAGPFTSGKLGKAGKEWGKALAPEDTLAACAPGAEGPDLAERWKGITGTRPWTRLESAGWGRALDVGDLDLVEAIRAFPDQKRGPGDLENVAAYAYRRVDLDRPTLFDLALRGSSGLRVWVDSVSVGEVFVAEGEASLDLALTLEAGTHHLLVKAVNLGGTWNLRFSGTDAVAQDAIPVAIDRGVAWLLAQQELDGSWPAMPEFGPGFTAFLMYALAASGLDAEHPAMRRGLAFLDTHPPEHVYSIGAVILARTALGRFDREELQAFADRLVDWQQPSGLWNYPVHPREGNDDPDLHNTMIASLAFDELRERGIELPRSSWRHMIRGALETQERTKSDARAFSYLTDREHTSGSMTVAGLTVLLIAKRGLGDAIPDGELAKLERGVEDGRRWIDRNLVWGREPHTGFGHYFWIYGLERVGSLLATETLGGQPWYERGAEFLLGAQTDEGYWESSYAEIDTALALLFLGRASGPPTPVPSSRNWRLAGSAAAESEGALLARVRRPAVLGDALECWLQDSKAPDLARVEWIARSAARAESLATVLATSGDGRFAAQLASLPREGFELVALGTLKSGQVLESAPITIAPLYTPDDLEFARHVQANLLRGARVATLPSGSTKLAEHAIDGSLYSAWTAWQQEEGASFSADLRRPAAASRLLLAPLRGREELLSRGRILRARVTINGAERFEVQIHPDLLRPTVVEFGSTLRVEQLEVTPLEVDWVDPHAGFSEIVLLP